MPTRHPITITLSLGLLAAAGASACSDDESKGLAITTAEVSERMRRNVRSHGSDLAYTVEDLVRDDAFADALGDDCEQTVLLDLGLCDGAGLTVGDDIDAEVDSLIETLFSDDALVRQSDTEIVYGLRAESTCESDAECERILQDVPIRWSVTAPEEETLRITLLVGRDEARPMALEISPDRLALTVDLGAARQATDALLAATGDEPTPIETMRGRVTYELLRLAEAEYEASFSIDETIEIADGPQSVRFAVEGRSTPVATARLDGERGEVEFAVDYGTIDVEVPGDMIVWEEQYDPVTDDFTTRTLSGRFALHLAGLSGSTAVAPTGDGIRVTNIGIGDEQSWLRVDGRDLLTVDLNANAGRRASFELRATTDGTQISVTPGLRIVVASTLQILADQIDDIAPWALNEQTTIAFEGGDPSALSILSAADEAVRVDDGALTLMSSSLSAPLVIEAGDCIESLDSEVDAHPFASLQSAACP